MSMEEMRLFNLHLSTRGLTCAVQEGDTELVCVGTPREGGGQGGVLIVWDPAQVLVRFHAQQGVIMHHRIVKAQMTFLKDGTSFALLGAYMPVRAGADEEVVVAWDLLEEAVVHDGNVCIGGDLNAETGGWLTGTGRRATLADSRLDRFLEDDESPFSVLTGPEPTYRVDTVATQIDHWLVSRSLAGRFREATTLPGICGDDHQILVTYLLHASANGGEERPKVKWPLTDDQWENFGKWEAQMVEEALKKVKQDGVVGEIGYWPSLMRALQTALTKCAEKASKKSRANKDKGVDADQEGEWGPTVAASKEERLRWQVAKWRRWRRAVVNWNGDLQSRRKVRMLSKIKELKEVMGNLVSYSTASERHKATLGVCDIHLRIATQTWEDHMDSPAVKGAGDRLLEKMKGAVAGHMGNTMN